MKKYKLVHDSSSERSLENLYRVVALRTFGTGENTVIAGERGGWVQHERNLSHEGNCWVREEACVRDHAKVEGNAIVAGSACVSERAVIDGDALVQGAASVRDDARVGQHAVIDGHALLRDNARVGGRAMVCADAVIRGNAIVRGLAHVHGDARLGLYTIVDGEMSISSKNWFHNGCDSRKIRLREIAETANSLILDHALNPDQERLLFQCGIIDRVTCRSMCGLTVTLIRANGRITATAEPEVLLKLAAGEEDLWLAFEDIGSVRLERVSPEEMLESKIEAAVPGYSQLPDWAREAVRSAYPSEATQFEDPACQNKLKTTKSLMRELRERARQIYGY